ncbi:MAG: hypothetical protein KatS3mg111_4178 [Pirellulaceae bacterium]|nr:MAG: hypothetical protein KatS3mg111_4178 [Pirellulaceae bacterium]
MTARHLEILVEEPSMEAFLRGLLPRLLPQDRSFSVYPFQGKTDLLAKLPSRLKGYAAWLPDEWRVVIVVDRDDDDCHELKRQLEKFSLKAGLRSRSHSPGSWQVVNRIAVEELEAWYFGDWDAVIAAFPKLSPNVPNQRGFRNSDAIAGGTWEAFERLLKRRGYFRGGLPKIEVARTLGCILEPGRCRSKSFQCFRDAIHEAVEPKARRDDAK